jgi:hypothetical protein
VARLLGEGRRRHITRTEVGAALVDQLGHESFSAVASVADRMEATADATSPPAKLCI